MSKLKVLVNTPDDSRPFMGGVANFYHSMIDYWSEDFKYNIVGKRKGVPGYVWLPWDLLKFIFRLLTFQPDAVLLNPSLNAKALHRDMIFQRVACALHFKTVILFHGFDLEYAKILDKEWACKQINKASLVMVLASQFKEVLCSWGITAPIELMTTKVEDSLIEDFDIDTRQGNVRNLLFLSRIEKAKGVYELVRAFELLKNTHNELHLTIVGGGHEFDALKDYLLKAKIDDVEMTGPIRGEARVSAFKKSDVFVFPSYAEGMPTVVLEAMAFGLPVVTRRVGGICDFFEEGKMGYSTCSYAPQVLAGLIEKLISGKENAREISQYNHQYALEHFMASKVGRKIESMIKQHCQ